MAVSICAIASTLCLAERLMNSMFRNALTAGDVFGSPLSRTSIQ